MYRERREVRERRETRGRKETGEVKGVRDAKESENMEAARKQALCRMEQMRKMGVEFFLDGRAVLPSEAVAKAVRENSPYMADYVLGTAGNIEQVRFDKVTRC